MSKSHLNPDEGHHCPANRWSPRTWSGGKKATAFFFVVVVFAAVLLGLCALLRPDLLFAGQETVGASLVFGGFERAGRVI